MSTKAVRLTPAVLTSVPWPAGELESAVDALTAGDVVGCGAAVMRACGLDPDADDLFTWWCAALPRRV